MRALRAPGAGAVFICIRETEYRFCYSIVGDTEHKTGSQFDPAARGRAVAGGFGWQFPECVRAASGPGGHRKVTRQYTPGVPGIYVTVVTRGSAISRQLSADG